MERGEKREREGESFIGSQLQWVLLSFIIHLLIAPS